MPRLHALHILRLLAAIAVILLGCFPAQAREIDVNWQNLTTPATFPLFETATEDDVILTFRGLHWVKQGQVGLYDTKNLTAPNPDSDLLAFRNVGPSARITFVSDPGNLQFGPLLDFPHRSEQAG
jgi:hypothetical protein